MVTDGPSLFPPQSNLLQAYPVSVSPRAERCPPLQSGGPSHPRHRARLEHSCQPRTHGRNHVRGVSAACILHRKYTRIKRVRDTPHLLVLALPVTLPEASLLVFK